MTVYTAARCPAGAAEQRQRVADFARWFCELKRFSRRWQLSLIAACLMLIFFLSLHAAAASDHNQGSRRRTAAKHTRKQALDTSGFLKTGAEGKFGNRFMDATYHEPITFNPALMRDNASMAFIGPVFDCLVSRRPDTLQFEPNLAATYTVSADGRTWTFVLRNGLKWSDGQPVTADDVIFTFDVLNDPQISSTVRDLLLIDGKPLRYQKISDRRIRFDLPRPFSSFLDAIGSIMIIPKHKLAAAWRSGNFQTAWSISAPPASIVGTGPFVLVNYRPGQLASYKRNPYYWRLDKHGKQLPFLDGGETLIVKDDYAASHTSDFLSLAPKQWVDLQQDKTVRNYNFVNAGPTWGVTYLCFNQNPHADNLAAYKREWFSNKDFRQAISYAIDREAIIHTILSDMGRPIWSPISEANKVYYKPDVRRYLHDVAQAKALLTGMGFVDEGDGYLKDAAGHPLEFTLVTNMSSSIDVSYADAIQENLKEIGIKVQTLPLEFNELVSRLSRTFAWDAVVLGFTGGIDPYNSRTIWASSGALHIWNPQQTVPTTPWEAEIDQIFTDAAITEDEGKRKELYGRFQEIVAEQQPLIFLVTIDALFMIRKRLQNTRPTALGGVKWNLYEVWVQ